MRGVVGETSIHGQSTTSLQNQNLEKRGKKSFENKKTSLGVYIDWIFFYAKYINNVNLTETFRTKFIP